MTLPANDAAPPPPRRFDGWAPLGLLLLGAIPALAGALRLASFAPGGPPLTDGARFAARPAVLAVHIAAALVYWLAGAAQFWPSLRRARPAWHRAVGYAVAPSGIIAGLAGLAAMLVYAPQPTAGVTLHALRAASGVAMVGSLVAGLAALRRRAFEAHGAWMTRAYAIGVAPGTQALMLAPLTFAFGVDTELTYTVGMALGWLINLAVAERIVRRRAAARAPSMPAVVYDRYGGPEELRLSRVPRPSPGAGQVLVRVEASSLNAVDRRMLRADPFLVRLVNGLVRPRGRVLGADVVGVIEAVGPEVRDRSVGERVFGDASNHGLGGFGHRVCLPSTAVAPVPAGLDAFAAAALPLAAGTALQAVRERARVRPGQRVLVDGAGGGVGAYLVQIAKAYGAHVTAVCGPGSMATVHALGADAVIDRTQPDGLATDARFDAVFGVNGERPLAEHLARLVPGGTYVMVGGGRRQLFEALILGAWRARRAGRRLEVLTMDPALLPRDLAEIRALVARGALRPVVDRVVPIERAADAMRDLEAGRVRGKLVLDLGAFAVQSSPDASHAPRADAVHRAGTQ
jgi:NADPH:quinone reductase-like Zn-dependent oxidoreductase